jgi:hypothetical protein
MITMSGAWMSWLATVAAEDAVRLTASGSKATNSKYPARVVLNVAVPSASENSTSAGAAGSVTSQMCVVSEQPLTEMPRSGV